MFSGQNLCVDKLRVVCNYIVMVNKVVLVRHYTPHFSRLASSDIAKPKSNAG
jgi:hypothetical protein